MKTKTLIKRICGYGIVTAWIGWFGVSLWKDGGMKTVILFFGGLTIYVAFVVLLLWLIWSD